MDNRISIIKIISMTVLFLLLLTAIPACTSSRMEKTEKDSMTTLAQAATETQEYVLENNSVYQLHATAVTKEIDGNSVGMFSYNNQIPGPLLHVQQGTTVW